MSIIVFLLILTVIIFVHELGHFLTAKKFGVYCKEFAIGMGPKIWSKLKGETTYSVRAIPMGGFVQMLGEDGDAIELQHGDNIWLEFAEEAEEQVITRLSYEKPDAEATQVEVIAVNREIEPIQLTYRLVETGEEHTRACQSLVYAVDADNQEQWLIAKDRQFTYLKPWKKLIILVAGATMNFIFAFLFVLVATGITGVTSVPIIATDLKQQADAQVEVLLPGDEILSINGETFAHADDVVAYTQAHPDTVATLVVQRDGDEVTMQRPITGVTRQAMTSEGIVDETIGVLGVTYAKQHYVGDIIRSSFQRYGDMFQQIFFVLGSLFNGNVHVTDLSGFVGIAQATGTVIESSSQASGGSVLLGVLPSLLIFAAFLSVNIGVMNLLPFPALDGGRSLFAFYEMIFKKRANPRFELYLNAAGFILLIGLFVVVTAVDIRRLFS